MDQTTTCQLVAAAGAIYATQTLLVPHTYLDQDDIEATEKTESITRSADPTPHTSVLAPPFSHTSVLAPITLKMSVRQGALIDLPIIMLCYA